jgi:hypothetical protein
MADADVADESNAEGGNAQQDDTAAMTPGDDGDTIEIGGEAGGAATDDGDVVFEYGDRCF